MPKPYLAYTVKQHFRGASTLCMVVRLKNAFRDVFMKIPCEGSDYAIHHEHQVLTTLNQKDFGIFPHLNLQHCSIATYYVPFQHIPCEDGSGADPLDMRLSTVRTDTSPYAIQVLTNSYIRPVPIQSDTWRSILYQVLIVPAILHTLCGYTHYDLHDENIVVSTSVYDRGDYALFILDEHNQFIVDTQGVCPVIVDHEFAWVDGCASEALPSLSHKGYLSWRSDPHTDARRMLHTAVGSFPMDDTSRDQLERLLTHLYPDYDTQGLPSDASQSSIIEACTDSLTEMVSFDAVSILTEYADFIVGELFTWAVIHDADAQVLKGFSDEVVVEDGFEALLGLFDEHDVADIQDPRCKSIIHNILSVPDLPVQLRRLASLVLMRIKDLQIKQDEQSSTPEQPSAFQVFGALQHQWGIVQEIPKRIIAYDCQNRTTFTIPVNDDLLDVFYHTPSVSMASTLYDLLFV